MASALRERIDYIKTSFQAMTPRERTLITGLGAAVGLVVLLVLWYFVADGLEQRAERVAEMRRAIDILGSKGDELRSARMMKAKVDARIEAGAVPMLQAHLDKIAKDVGLDVKEYKTLKDRFLDKKERYRERSVRLSLLGVDLDSLTKFMDRIEGGRYLVMVTQLRVQTRPGQPDKLDVEMVVSTYEKVEGKSGKGKTKRRGSSRPRSRGAKA